MLKYITYTALLFCTTWANLQAQEGKHTLQEAYIQTPTIDLAQTIKMAIYLGDKHSPNKVVLPYKVLTKTMNSKNIAMVFDEYMRQINYQLSFLQYDYNIIEKDAFADKIKTRLMSHPQGKHFSQFVNLMVAQLEQNFATIKTPYISLNETIKALKLTLNQNITFPGYTGDFFWTFLQTAFNPYENLKVILDKEIKPLEAFQKDWQNSSTIRNFYWDIQPLYTESQGKYLNTEFFLTYMQEQIQSAKNEAEKELYIVVSQDIARAAKKEYYIPAYYLEKVQSAVHQYMKKERFMQHIAQMNNTTALKNWFNTIEKGFSLALLPLSLIQDNFEVQLKASNTTLPITITGSSKTFVHNNSIKANTYNIALKTTEIVINNKTYTVELNNPIGVESAINNRRALVIYPKGIQDKSLFLQINLLFYANQYKIESYRMEVGITTMDLVKDLKQLDIDLYNFSELVKVFLVS